VPFPALYRCYCRNLGRRGWTEAGRLIAAAADRADSAAERILKQLLRDAGITGWVVGHRFGPHLIDLAFPARRVAVEVDGWAWHVDVDRFRADRRKGRAYPPRRLRRPSIPRGPHPGRLDPAALHLARPGHQTARGGRGDPPRTHRRSMITRNGRNATNLSLWHQFWRSRTSACHGSVV
jgi:hypothetical protein